MNWDESHPTYKKELGQRLLSVFARFTTKQAAADVVGVTVQQLNKWAGGGEGEIPRVPVNALLALSEAAGVDFYWLATGEGFGPILAGASPTPVLEADESMALVQRYNVCLSAGHGSFTDWAEPLDKIPFTQDFFTRRLRRKPENMIIVDASGDSMFPTIANDDLVMIDTTDRRLTGAIWAFSYGEAIFVKRLNILPDALEVRSDNAKDYPSFIIDANQMSNVNIIGRVVWVGRTL